MIQSIGFGMLLVRGLVLVAAGTTSLLNGSTWSPFFDTADYLLGIAMRGYPFATRAVIYNYVTPLAIAAMTLLIAGIPAAVYERIRGLPASSTVSLAIWLIGTVLLSMPTLARLVAGN